MQLWQIKQKKNEDWSRRGRRNEPITKCCYYLPFSVSNRSIIIVIMIIFLLLLLPPPLVVRFLVLSCYLWTCVDSLLIGGKLFLAILMSCCLLTARKKLINDVFIHTNCNSFTLFFSNIKSNFICQSEQNEWQNLTLNNVGSFCVCVCVCVLRKVLHRLFSSSSSSSSSTGLCLWKRIVLIRRSWEMKTVVWTSWTSLIVDNRRRRLCLYIRKSKTKFLLNVRVAARFHDETAKTLGHINNILIQHVSIDKQPTTKPTFFPVSEFPCFVVVVTVFLLFYWSSTKLGPLNESNSWLIDWLINWGGIHI